jgi:hypothetical protein
MIWSICRSDNMPNRQNELSLEVYCGLNLSLNHKNQVQNTFLVLWQYITYNYFRSDRWFTYSFIGLDWICSMLVIISMHNTVHFIFLIMFFVVDSRWMLIGIEDEKILWILCTRDLKYIALSSYLLIDKRHPLLFYGSC